MLELQKSNSSPHNCTEESNTKSRRIVPYNQQNGECYFQAVSFKNVSMNNSFNQVEEKNKMHSIQESHTILTKKESKDKKFEMQSYETEFKTLYPASDTVIPTNTNQNVRSNSNNVLMDDISSTQKNEQYNKSKLRQQNSYYIGAKDSVIEKENMSFINQSEQLSGNSSSINKNNRRGSKIVHPKFKDPIFSNAIHIKKFLNKLKSKTSNYILDLLTENIFNLIYDKSSDYGQFMNQRKIKQKDKEKTLVHKLIIRLAGNYHNSQILIFLSQSYLHLALQKELTFT